MKKKKMKNELKMRKKQGSAVIKETSETYG
jgi:hypothetical protein